MSNNFKIRTLDNLQGLISQCKLSGINWKGDKLYICNNGNTISLGSLIKELEKTYHSEYFIGAQLSDKDCDKLKNIKNKIVELDSQEIETSGLQSLYLKVITVVQYIFFFGKGDNKKDVLLNEIAARSERPNESLLLHGKAVKTDLSDQVRDALQYSYENYYKIPYKDSSIRKREAMRIAQGERVERYNHGLAHTTRKVFFIPFIVEYLLRHGKDHLSNQLKTIINEEGIENVIQKLQLAITFEVAGRESECGPKDKLKIYKSYLASSANALVNYCKEKDLIGEGKLFKNEQDVISYSEKIKNKYSNTFLGEKMDVLTVILNMAHMFDLFRCFWPSRMKSELDEMNHYFTKDKNNRDLWELAKFCQKAIQITGDRMMTEFSEGIHQRSRPFAINDFTSCVFRNFAFTNEHTFVNCSSDSQYCWELLKRIPPPISYSRGETTFSYLSEEKKEDEGKMPPSSAKEALDIISQGKAAIRLVNTSKEKFGFEMEMINNPVFFRPTRTVKKERDWVLLDRKSKVVIKRKFKKERFSLQKQIANQQEQSRSQDQRIWKSVHSDKDRGLSKFTEFTKKLSFSLLRSDGKVCHFKGEFPREYGKYKPIGFLYDVDQLGQKDQKFVFRQDVGTTSKFWVGKDALINVDKKEGRDTHLTLKDLQEELKGEVSKGVPPHSLPFYKMQHASNEMLMCSKKSAIKAVFATEDTPQARLRTFLHAIYLAKDYGIHVPTLIVDGENSPRAYIKREFEQDLEMLSSQSKSSNKELIQDLYSCFFSKEDIQEKSKQELHDELKDQCNTFF